MKRIYILVVLVVFVSYQSFAQVVTVKNRKSEETIDNVAVFNQFMNKATLSNMDGRVDLEQFAQSDTLYFQHPSFETYTVHYKDLPNDGVVFLARKNILIPEFVVTATKHRENKKDVAYLVDVLTPKKIDQIPTLNSADLLAATGNVFVQKSQAGGGSPVLRGFEANKVLLVVDGVRMNNAIYRSGHLQNALTIDNAILERVEVIYGPTAVVYGSDALGGVIHYMTKTPELMDTSEAVNVGGTAYLRGASATNSIKGHLDVNLGFKKIAFLSSITYSSFGDMQMGYRRNPFYDDWGLQKDYVTQINGIDSLVANADEYKVRQAGYEQVDLMQKIFIKPSDFVDLEANFQYSNSTDIHRQDQLNNREDGIPEFAVWNYGPQRRTLGMLKSRFYRANDIYDHFEATVTYQDIEESRITREYRQDTVYRQTEGVQVGTVNLDFFKKVASKHDFSFGFDFNYNKVGSTAEKSSIITDAVLPSITRYPDEGTSTMASGAYVSYKTRLHRKLITAAGLRMQYYTLNAAYGDFYNDLPDVFRNVDLEAQSMTYSLSFIVNQTSSFNWNVITSTGFRCPNLDDLAKIRLTSGKLTLPNADLKPEYSYNGEIGFSKTFDGYIQINGNYFVSYLTEAITRLPYAFEDGSDSVYFQGRYRSTYQNANSTEALIHGFTVNLISDLNSDLSFKSTLNYTYGRDLSNDEPLAHIPPIFGRTEFSYELGKLFFEINLVYAGWKYIENMVTTGEDKEDEATIHGYPGWYTINLNSIYTITNFLDLQLSVENVTDNYYKPYASGVPAPGINFVGTIRAKF